MAYAPLLLASRGLTGERDPSRIKTGDLIVATNLDLTSGNLAQKAGGSSKVNSVAISSGPHIVSGIEWVPVAGTTRRVIGTNDGRLMKDDMTGAFATTLASGLTASNTSWLLEAGAEVAGNNRKLFAFTGNNAAQVLSADGATTGGVATPHGDWSGTNQPQFGFIFRNSVVAGGNANAAHRVYGSAPANHEDFTGGTSFTLNIYPGEGHKIVGGVTAVSRGFIFKYPTGIYWINDAAETVAGWYSQPANRQFGAADTPHAITQVDQGTVAFLTSSGDIVLMQETGGSLSGVEFINLTKALNLRSFMRNNFNLGLLARCQLKWYDDKKELHLLIPALGATTNTRRLVIDFNEERTRVYTIDKDVNQSMWFEKDSDGIYRPHTGDASGFVWKLDTVDRNVDGASYTFKVQTAHTDFSDVDTNFMVKKLFYRIHLEYEPTGDYDLACDIIVDGRTIGTANFNQGDTVAQLPFTLSAVLGGEDLRRRSKDIAGEGYYISLVFRESGTHNPRIARAWVEFKPLSAAR